MEIFGIGAPELLFIIVIVLLVLGPRDMEKAGLTVGRWLNKLISSDGWFLFQKTAKELRDLPNSWMKEANLEMKRTEEEIRKELNSQYFRSHSTNRPASSPQISAQPNSIEPPIDARPDEPKQIQKTVSTKPPTKVQTTSTKPFRTAKKTTQKKSSPKKRAGK